MCTFQCTCSTCPNAACAIRLFLSSVLFFTRSVKEISILNSHTKLFHFIYYVTFPSNNFPHRKYNFSGFLACVHMTYPFLIVTIFLMFPPHPYRTSLPFPPKPHGQLSPVHRHGNGTQLIAGRDGSDPTLNLDTIYGLHPNRHHDTSNSRVVPSILQLFARPPPPTEVPLFFGFKIHHGSRAPPPGGFWANLPPFESGCRPAS